MTSFKPGDETSQLEAEQKWSEHHICFQPQKNAGASVMEEETH